MARHKKRKDRKYWAGIAGTALIVLSGLFAINDRDGLINDPVAIVTPAPIPTGTPGRPAIVIDDIKELNKIKRPRVEITNSPNPTPTEFKEKPPEIVGKLYATEALRIRMGPGTDYEVVDVVSRGAKLSITGTEEDGWAQVIYDDEIAWVSVDYLSETEPPPPPPVYYEECKPSGSPAEIGLTPDALHVIRCIEENFPQIDEYGGVAPRANVSDHPTGRAVDAMIPNWDTTAGNELGWTIAKWIQKRAKAFGVTYIIFDARIWSVDRAGEGWRSYSHPSGSTSATMLHLDHVHVSVEGSSGYNYKD